MQAHRHSVVVAYLALFVALSGTSYAAVRLGKNAVKTANIAPNAVTSAKVRDGSLLAGDFAAGQLPAGRAGATGAPGPAGAPGAPGAPGERGPSDAYSAHYGDVSPGGLGSAFRVGGELALPPGDYFAYANTWIRNNGPATNYLYCWLYFDDASQEIVDKFQATLPPSSWVAVSLEGMGDLTRPGRASLVCQESGGTGIPPLVYNDVDVGAVRVADWH